MSRRSPLFLILLVLLALVGCSASKPRSATTAVSIPQIRLNDEPTKPTPGSKDPYPVMLGIDVLEQRGFDVLKGKRVGLLTHLAGVNRRGESTIDVLRRAPGIKLVALYALEHGLRSDLPAEKTYQDFIDPHTKIQVFSLYNNKSRWPTAAQLKPIDVMVVDLQDVGSRSYTYVSAMRYAMESCFRENKEFVVLDRPNPLGGLKVDGPPLDQKWVSYVGAFRTPYVHGLTIGELARMAKELPGSLQIDNDVRERGKLTVIPMKGWHRSTRWPETGLKWIPTSPMVTDFHAAYGYAMTGLGCITGGFHHGVGEHHAFRGVGHKTLKDELIERELNALRLPGLKFKRITVSNKKGQPATGLYIDIVNYNDWNPTELSFHLMKLACKYDPKNPFARLPQGEANGFLRHMGSTAFFEAIKRDGAKIDVDAFLRDWQQRSKIFQQASKRFWLYN